MPMKWLINIFQAYKRIKYLEMENDSLKDRLKKAQDNINRTNSYWKSRLHGHLNPKNKV